MLYMLFIAFLLPPIMISLNMMLFKKSMMHREKLNPFECGFDPQSHSRIPFSLKFYLIAIIFLIFDIEIAIILPIPIILESTLTWKMNILLIMFLFIFLAGLLYEWKEGALKWLY